MREQKSTQTITAPAPAPKAGIPANRAKQSALAAAAAAIDKKAERVKILDLGTLSGFTDFFVLCSGASNRQVHAIASSVETRLRESGRRAIAIEGLNEGRWVLLDFGDVVVHVFLDAIRDYYDLDSLWADAPRVPVPAEFYGPAASPQE